MQYKTLKTNALPENVSVIGSGFSGLAASAVLASTGANVTVFEKHAEIGGRARTFSQSGFMFDMGPSWYWMPDVYEHFFQQFGATTSDFYDLRKLDPGFSVIFGREDVIDIPADFDDICTLFESVEPGSASKLRRFIQEGEFKYNTGMHEMVYKPGHSVSEFFSLKLFRDAWKLQLFTSLSKHARQYFKDPRLIAIIEFPVLFLGAMPQETPALYSLMNFSALKQGTYYPMGGFGKVAESFRKIAEHAGVTFAVSHQVEKLETDRGRITHIHCNGSRLETDAVIGSADYHYIENQLLDPEFRSYTEAYWESRVFAPSALLFYLGINKKVDRLRHHNLFFDENFEQHAIEIYKKKSWPSKPLFYVCCPSKTDPSVAPEGSENLFVLMPIATGLADPSPVREHYYNILMDRLEGFTGEKIREHVVFKKSYSVSDFVQDYNAYKGNAYGLANTLMQTAIFKPKLKSKKVKNLFYAGQLTVPGPGVPPSIISGQIAAKELLKFLNRQR
jgi:phytoene desaturase